MVIPLASLLVGGLISFALVCATTLFMNVVFITPSLMMSMLVATSIDYSLFILSRYREELMDAPRVDPRRAVRAAMASGGHTVLVSGVTLAVCFAGLILLPLDSMRSLGIGTSVAVLVSLAVNLTLTPVLLLSAPRFFARCVAPVRCCGGAFTLSWGARDYFHIVDSSSTSTTTSTTAGDDDDLYEDDPFLPMGNYARAVESKSTFLQQMFIFCVFFNRSHRRNSVGCWRQRPCGGRVLVPHWHADAKVSRLHHLPARCCRRLCLSQHLRVWL